MKKETMQLIEKKSQEAHESEKDMLQSVLAIHGEEAFKAAAASCSLYSAMQNLIEALFVASKNAMSNPKAMLALALLEGDCRRAHDKSTRLMLDAATKGDTKAQIEICKIMGNVNKSHLEFMHEALILSATSRNQEEGE